MTGKRTIAELSAIYGASPHRWPETPGDGARGVPEEAQLDALLDADVPPEVPDGLAARIKAVAMQPACADALPPLRAPRRAGRGWSRGRRILVAAGAANLFLASAVAAAFVVGVPAPVRELLGLAPAVMPQAPVVKRPATPSQSQTTIASEAVEPLMPAAQPELGGGRMPLAEPEMVPLRLPAQRIKTLRTTPARPEQPGSRLVEHRHERLIERPVNMPETPKLPRERPDGVDNASRAERIEAVRERLAETTPDLTSEPGAVRSQLPDSERAQALREARAGIASEVAAAGSAVETPPPPAVATTTGEEASAKAVTAERPERFKRPPRRLRERLQRQRPNRN